MNTINIFLASSSELYSERMEIAALTADLNNALRDFNVFIQLVKWEYLDASVSSSHNIKQGDYNDELEKCDMCMVLFWQKYGMYTAEEVQVGSSKYEHLFFKEGGTQCDELKSFKDSVIKAGRPFSNFSNDEELKGEFLFQVIKYIEENYQINIDIKIEDNWLVISNIKLINLPACKEGYLDKVNNLTCNSVHESPTATESKDLEITIFLSSTSDLHAEYLILSDLAANLNKSFSKKNIKIFIKKWESYQSPDYPVQLKESDLFLVLYWQNFGLISKDNLDIACSEMKSGHNPNKIFIYFKDGNDLSQDIESFRDNFVNLYGHFFCHFDNPEALKAEFVLQILNYVNEHRSEEGLINIKSSQLVSNGECLVDLGKVPFVSLDSEYQMICNNIKKTKKLIAVTEADDPDLIEYSRDLEELENKKHEKELNIWQIALHIAKLSNQSSSDRLNRAITCFRKGDNKGANAILNEEEIEKEGEIDIKRIKIGEEGKKSLKIKVDELELKIKILFAEKPDDWWTTVINLYKKSIEWGHYCLTDKELSGLFYELASFYDDQTLYPEAIAQYKEAITYKAKAGLEDQVYKVKVHLAEVYKASLNYKEALSIIKECENYFRKNTEGSDLENKEYLARTLHLESKLLANMGKESLSNEIYKEVISLMEFIVSQNKEAHHIVNLAVAYNTEATSKNINNEKEIIDSLLNKSISLFKSLTTKDFEDFIGNYGDTVKDYAGFNYAIGNFDKAESLYSEALEIFRKLAAQNPNHYLSNVASLLFCKGQGYYGYNKYDSAVTVLSEAKDIYNKLAEHKSYLFLRVTAHTCSLLGRTYHCLKKFDMVESLYSEALALLKELALKDNTYTITLASQFYCNACFYRDTKKYRQSIEHIKEAIKLYKGFEPTIGNIISLIQDEILLSRLYRLTGETEKQESEIKDVDHYMKDIHLESLSIDQKEKLANCLADYGADLCNINNDEALRKYKDAYYLLDSIVEKGKYYYADFKDKAEYYVEMLNYFDMYADAIKVYDRLIQVANQYSTDKADDYAKDIAYFYNEMGKLYVDMNDFDKTLAAYEKSIALKKGIASIVPDYEFEESKTLNNMAILYNAMKEFQKAENFHKEAIDIKTKFFNIDPEKYKNSLLLSYKNISNLYLKLGRIDEVIEICQKAYRIDEKGEFALWLGYAYELKGDNTLSQVYYAKSGCNEDEIEEFKSRWS